MSQKQTQKQKTKTTAAPQETERGQKATPIQDEDMDAFMADIDGVLEEMGEEFAQNYHQKGGE